MEPFSKLKGARRTFDNSPHTRRDLVCRTEGLEARVMAHLNTPDVKSDRFENKLITHQKICPVAGAYAAPTQKGTADADSPPQHSQLICMDTAIAITRYSL